jgi:hypothetical protein
MERDQMKQVHIRTVTPIEINESVLLDVINSLRKEYGEGKKNKAPIRIENDLPKLNLFQNRDEENGMLSFLLSYEDENKIPCTRYFPNFGLDVKSQSKLERNGDKFLLTVDFNVIAGKQKWQIAEITECAKVFQSGNYKLALVLTLDTTTEFAGYCAQVQTNSDTTDSVGMNLIPSDCFQVEIK